MNGLLIFPTRAVLRFVPRSNSISNVASVSWKTTSFKSGGSRRDFCTRSAPDMRRLAETARITLTEQEVEEVGPKIQQVLDWFGQLQAVDLESVAPSMRADTEGDNLREDVPEIFENKEGIVAAIPSYEEPYINVPKVLNKE